VIAIADRLHDPVAQAMSKAARAHHIDGNVMRLAAAVTGANG
jgi:hypothetical protein